MARRFLALLLALLIQAPSVGWAAIGDGLPLIAERGSTGMSDPSPSLPDVPAPPSDGSFRFAYPIVLPRGTGGLGPQISLRYSSAARRDSWVGYGWSLDLGRIQRSLREGVPAYGTSDRFELDGERLVDVGGTYKTRRESFRKIDFDDTSNSWEVRSKDGTTFRYGTTSDSRIDGPGANDTFAWLLSEVEDVHGNAYTVTYAIGDPGNPSVDDGVRYPEELRYTLRRTANGLESMGRDRLVVFETEARPDPSLSYAAGIEQRLEARLRSVEVRIEDGGGGSDLIRRYEFSYAESLDSFRSLLAGIDDFGADAQGTPRSTSFSYTYNVGQCDQVAGQCVVGGASCTDDADCSTSGWSNTSWSFPDYNTVNFVRNDLQDGGTRVADMNGDGLPDLARFVKIKGSSAHEPGSGVYLNTGGGFSTNPNTSYTLPDDGGLTSEPHTFTTLLSGNPQPVRSRGTFVLDLDRDGKADLLHVSGQGVDYGSLLYLSLFEVFRSQGSWFRTQIGGGVDPDTWTPPGFKDYSLSQLYEHDLTPQADPWVVGKTQVAELNGDGLPDLVNGYSLNYPTSVARYSYALNNLGMWFEDWPCPDLVDTLVMLPEQAPPGRAA